MSLHIHVISKAHCEARYWDLMGEMKLEYICISSRPDMDLLGFHDFPDTLACNMVSCSWTPLSYALGLSALGVQ